MFLGNCLRKKKLLSCAATPAGRPTSLEARPDARSLYLVVWRPDLLSLADFFDPAVSCHILPFLFPEQDSVPATNSDSCGIDVSPSCVAYKGRTPVSRRPAWTLAQPPSSHSHISRTTLTPPLPSSRARPSIEPSASRRLARARRPCPS
jgi:hypothetical protein